MVEDVVADEKTKAQEDENNEENEKLMESAINKNDLSMCNQLQSERNQEICKTNVNFNNKVLKNDLHKEAIKKQDRILCDKIQDEEVKKDCHLNIIVQLAGQKQDVDLCNEILDIGYPKNIVADCKTRVQNQPNRHSFSIEDLATQTGGSLENLIPTEMKTAETMTGTVVNPFQRQTDQTGSSVTE